MADSQRSTADDNKVEPFDLVVFGGAMLILSMLGTIKPSRTRVAHLGVIEPGTRSTRTGEMG